LRTDDDRTQVEDRMPPTAGTPFADGVLARVVPSDVTLTGNPLRDLLDAILAVASELELPDVLNRFVEVSAELTNAKYGAINVLDATGRSTTFVYTGVPTAIARAMAHAPHALGVLGQIPNEGALRLDDLTQHPAFIGFPKDHPPMGSFLGASVRVGARVFGQLYLSERLDGRPFDEHDEEVVVALAAAAGVAVANAQLYAEASRREHWLRAGQDITMMLLEGVDEEEALDRIVETAREVARADTAAMAMPGVGGQLTIELAHGDDSEKLIGIVMPEGGRAWTVMTEGRGLLTSSLAGSTPRIKEWDTYGPAMFAPLQTSGHGVGVLILLRHIGAPPFEQADLTTAESFASQAALAYVLAEARHAQDVAALFDERERIARDLHDLAIQQLFATGMQLETIRRRAARGVDPSELLHIVDDALDNVDSSVRQIRQIVYALRDPDAATGLVERLRREASLARTGLGFAPSLVLTIDEKTVGDDDEDFGEIRIDERVSAELTDDVVAVVREGLANAARHAHAASVAVRVSVTGEGHDGSVRVEVSDDGRGLPPGRDRSSGVGNLLSRARQHGGTFEIGDNPEGRGTLLVWLAPLSHR
jgi:signal transduction histidine kinase